MRTSFGMLEPVMSTDINFNQALMLNLCLFQAVPLILFLKPSLSRYSCCKQQTDSCLFHYKLYTEEAQCNDHIKGLSVTWKGPPTDLDFSIEYFVGKVIATSWTSPDQWLLIAVHNKNSTTFWSDLRASRPRHCIELLRLFMVSIWTRAILLSYINKWP